MNHFLAMVIDRLETAPIRPTPIKRVFNAPASPAMLARLFTGETPARFSVEPKIDGVRVIITADTNLKTVRFQTRNGNELLSLSHLSDEILHLVSGVPGITLLDAEATSGLGFFDGVGALRSKASATDACLWVFDLPAHEGTQEQRRNALCQMFAGYLSGSIRLIPSYTEISPMKAYSIFRAQGHEGAMVKDLNAKYAKGKRSSAWLKIKDKDTADCLIIEIIEGRGKCAKMAGHIVVSYNGHKVRVGTGMTDELRKELLIHRNAMIGKVAEVSMQMMTPSGSMRHPSLIGIRGDK